MPISENCRQAVNATISELRAVRDQGASVEHLTQAKESLIALAKRKDLFTFEAFPLPTDDAMECSYLIHEDETGDYALYVNSGAPHQYYAPHDHGNAWAIIAGVEGRERHQLYEYQRSGEDGRLVKKGEIVVEAGEAVTMQPEGIHEVNAMDGRPLLHLHLYARNFVAQGERWKYDAQSGAVEAFHLDELGGIIDAR